MYSVVQRVSYIHKVPRYIMHGQYAVDGGRNAPGLWLIVQVSDVMQPMSGAVMRASTEFIGCLPSLIIWGSITRGYQTKTVLGTETFQASAPSNRFDVEETSSCTYNISTVPDCCLFQPEGSL